MSRSSLCSTCSTELRTTPDVGAGAFYDRRVATVFDGIDDALREWIGHQPMFFVATAPSGDDGHINCSPKGLPGSFVVLDENTVAYLDLTGSGAETIAHVRDNGRIVIMFCAFDKRPRIVRLHGRANVVVPGDPMFSQLRPHFGDYLGVRSIIVVDVTRVSDSCGYGVPRMSFEEERPNLPLDHDKRGDEGLAEYRRENNATSIDGLPALN